MNFKSRGIRLNNVYLHRLIIGRDDVNIMIKSVEKEINTIQSQDLH